GRRVAEPVHQTQEPQLTERDRQTVNGRRDAHPQQAPNQPDVGDEVRDAQLQTGAPAREYDEQQHAPDDVAETGAQRDPDEAETRPQPEDSTETGAQRVPDVAQLGPRADSETQHQRERYVQYRDQSEHLQPGARVAGAREARRARGLCDLKRE